MRRFLDLLLPNRQVGRSTRTLLIGGWLAAALLVWLLSPFATLPGPGEVWHALSELWWQGGLGPELFTTLKLIFQALLLTLVISLPLAWASVVPLVRPLVEGLSKLRFLGLVGLVFPFTLLTGGGYRLKVALLVFGMTTYFVTSLAQVVADVPRARFDHLRVLGAGELRIAWEVVVRGTLAPALEVMRQNLAIGWTMITMVEGISRAEGGLGAMLLNQNKHFRLAEVYALLLVILAVGLAIDLAMARLTASLCPYAKLTKVQR